MTKGQLKAAAERLEEKWNKEAHYNCIRRYNDLAQRVADFERLKKSRFTAPSLLKIKEAANNKNINKPSRGGKFSEVDAFVRGALWALNKS